MADETNNVELTAPKLNAARLSAEKALPQSGSDTLVKIIKGYAVASGGGASAVNYKDVAAATNLSPTLVSSNNSFLTESGFIQSPKYGFYLPSEGAVRFAREAAWGEDKAKIHLRKIGVGTWYGSVALQNLAMRSSIVREELKRSLAIKCGATEGDGASLDRLIDFVVNIGLIVEGNDGSLTRGNLDEVDVTTDVVPAPVATPVSTSQPASTVATHASREEARASVSVVLHVHVHDWGDLTLENAAALRTWLKAVDEDGAEVSVEGMEKP